MGTMGKVAVDPSRSHAAVESKVRRKVQELYMIELLGFG